MNETLHKTRPLSRWRRILLILVLLALTPLIILMLVNSFLGRQLGAEITKISNAGEPIKFSDVKTVLQSDGSDNGAAKYYLAMLADIYPINIEQLARLNSFYRKNLITLPPNQFPENLSKSVAADLKRFQPNFAKLDQASSLGLSFVDLGLEQSRNVSAVNFDRIQTAAFLSSLRTMDFFLRDQDDSAADSIMSMLKLLRIFDSYPTMPSYIIKARFVPIVCEDIRLLIRRGNVSGPFLQKLCIALKEIIPPNALETMFLIERVYQIEFARNMFPRKTRAKFLQQQPVSQQKHIPRPRSLLTWFRIRKEATQYFRDISMLITASRKPWPGPFDSVFADTTSPAEKASKIITTARRIVLSSIGNRIIADCTMLSLTIERYRLLHNEIPESLEKLVPEYTETIPFDPFTGGKLLYQTSEDSYIVYSAGMNRIDDGGSIIPSQDRKPPKDWGLGMTFQKKQP